MNSLGILRMIEAICIVTFLLSGIIWQSADGKRGGVIKGISVIIIILSIIILAGANTVISRIGY